MIIIYAKKTYETHFSWLTNAGRVPPTKKEWVGNAVKLSIELYRLKSAADGHPDLLNLVQLAEEECEKYKTACTGAKSFDDSFYSELIESDIYRNLSFAIIHIYQLVFNAMTG